ncbi:MAG: YceI family protein [Halioglobus sp.]|nr:YceI family protein [Halioglobus sp.]
MRLHDRTLPEAEWFDVANHPTASFRATAITPSGDNQFRIAGVLEIKNNAIEVPHLVLTLQPDQATITGQLMIDRADADLGMESDPRGEWVSRQIKVDVEVTATPRQEPVGSGL